MKNDNVKQFVELRNQLQQEKSQIERRLAEINRALGEVSTLPAAAPRPAAAATATTSTSTAGTAARGRSGRGRRGQNTMSLREAIRQATLERPMTKNEIVDAVQRNGYRFTGKNPANSVGVILYGKNSEFVNESGYFRPRSGGASSQSASTLTTEKKGKAKKSSRQKRGNISPEGRARISAAAKARWARHRAGNA